MEILETKFGNDGYSFWFKLLEFLGKSENHFIDLNDEERMEYLQAKTRLDGITTEKVLALLAKLQAIDRSLWENDRIVWSQNLVDNLKPIYDNRKRPLPSKPVSTGKHPTMGGLTTGKVPAPPINLQQVIPQESKESKGSKESRDREDHRTEKIDHSDILDEGYNPPPDETNDPKDDTKPKKVRQPRSLPVTRFQEITKAWPNSEQIKLINETVMTNVDLDRFESVVKTWMLRGFKPTNIEGMIEWYRSGIPSRTNGGNKPIGKPATVASTEEDLDDWKKLQAEQKERQDARAAKEKQGGS
jgi:hypothetical protein